MTAARVNITFFFDEATVTEADLHERLDTMLVEGFEDLPDWHVRWVADLADSPLFGAATHPASDTLSDTN